MADSDEDWGTWKAPRKKPTKRPASPPRERSRAVRISFPESRNISGAAPQPRKRSKCTSQRTTGPRARVKGSGSAPPVSLFPALEATEAALQAATAAYEATAPPSKKAMSAADKERRKQARDALRQAKQKHMVELARQARFRANNDMPQAQPAASSSQQARVRHGDSEAVRGHGLIATTAKGRGPLANEASMQQTLETVEAVSSDESPAASS